MKSPLRRIREHGARIRARLKALTKMRLVMGPLTYNQDGLATRHNADFMHDTRFACAYDAGKTTGSWGGGVKSIGVRLWPVGRPRRWPG
jgi:hypothetical protein